MTVYNRLTNIKEENIMDKNTKNEEYIVPEPDWSIAMFWEDITSIVARLIELILSLF